MSKVWLVALLMGMGCASPTPYQRISNSNEFGYSDRQISDGRYFIRVVVNDRTSAGMAQDYLHRRSKQLCPKGYRLETHTGHSNMRALQVGKVGAAAGTPEATAIVVCQ